MAGSLYLSARSIRRARLELKKAEARTSIACARPSDAELNAASAAIAVEQIDDEITVAIEGVVGVHFQVTSEQALKISNALTAAAKNASEILSAGT